MKFCSSLILFVLAPILLFSQIFGPVDNKFAPFIQNSISNMAAFGDTIWVGPSLNRNIGNQPEWFTPENADSVVSGRGRLFSISLAQDTILAGLGYNFTRAGENVQTAQGFYISVDGGNDWRFINPPLDHPDSMRIRYGGQDIGVTPIIVPQQSPPFNVAFRGDVVIAAAWASGIRRSIDFGYTWDRILLPPFELDKLEPEGTYDFFFDPRTPSAGSPNLPNYPNGWRNFLAFSTMIEADGYTWAGTAGGINISPNFLTAPSDSIIWNHKRSTGSSTGMLGNWVIRVRQNPWNGEVWLTNWISDSGEKQGIVSTSDRGVNFRQHLIGERINDIGFKNETIYAAGDNGLFISRNNGQTWEQITRIESANSRLKRNAQFRSVATGADRVWLGSSDGLISTTDDGLTWEITRIDFPLSGGNIFQPSAPNVSSFAYPNPFSSIQHDVIRIKFNASTSGNVRIELYDYGMNLIRILNNGTFLTPGTYEAEWDGLDDRGRKVSNGPVFYRITGAGQEINGKFLVLN